MDGLEEGMDTPANLCISSLFICAFSRRPMAVGVHQIRPFLLSILHEPLRRLDRRYR